MSTSQNALYSDHQWSIIESLSAAMAAEHEDEEGYRTLSRLATFDPDSGPTLTAEGGGRRLSRQKPRPCLLPSDTGGSTTLHRVQG